MTAAKSSVRKRRSGATVRVPKNIASWFAGEVPISFLAMSYPHRFVLREYWEAWEQENPGATPPPNLRLDESFRGQAASLAETARKILNLRKQDGSA